MDESRRRQIRGWHAQLGYYCSCGKIVHGNGGKANHAYMHERRADGYHWLTSTAFYELFPRPTPRAGSTAQQAREEG